MASLGPSGNQYGQIVSGFNPRTTNSVLFVCTANQCRSPMAMVLLRDFIGKKCNGTESWQIESAGIWVTTGSPATITAIHAIKDLGLDLSEHISRLVTESLLNEFNLILCMEKYHKDYLINNFSSSNKKTYLLSEMSNEMRDIWDPVGKSISAYKEIIFEIRNIFEKGFNTIQKLSEK